MESIKKCKFLTECLFPQEGTDTVSMEQVAPSSGDPNLPCIQFRDQFAVSTSEVQVTPSVVNQDLPNIHVQDKFPVSTSMPVVIPSDGNPDWSCIQFNQILVSKNVPSKSLYSKTWLYGKN